MVGWWGRSTTPGRGLTLFPCPDPLITKSSRRCVSEGKEQRKATVSEVATVFDAIHDGCLSSRKVPKKPCGHPPVSSSHHARYGRRAYAQASKLSSDSGNTSSADVAGAFERKQLNIRHDFSASEDLKKALVLQARRPSSAEVLSQSSVRRVVPSRSNICSASFAADMTNLSVQPLASFAKADSSHSSTRRDYAKGFAIANDSVPQSHLSTRQDDNFLERTPSSSSRLGTCWQDSKNAIMSVREDTEHSRSAEHVANSEAPDCCISETWLFDRDPQDNDKDSSKTYSPMVPLNGRPSYSRSLSQCSTCEEWEPLQCSNTSAKCAPTIGPALVPAIHLPPSTAVNVEGDEELEVLRAQLADATKNAEILRSRVNATKIARELEAAEVRSRRQVATDALKNLVGLPLAEIKRLANSPPESIRRTLAATWVLLHCERYARKAVVFFDDVQDWSKVQRMLTKDNFVSQVTNFSPEKLDKFPLVRNYLFKTFFGDSVDTCSADRSSSRPSSRRSRPSSRQDSKSQVSAGTSLEAVSRASQPCGSLARWIIALLTERQALRELSDGDHGLADMTSDLDAAERRCVELARAISCAHAAKLAECAKPRVASAIDAEVVGPISPKGCTQVQLPARPKTAPPMEVPRLESRELPIRERIRRKVHGID